MLHRSSVTLAAVLADPSASYWLKGAIVGALDRDPIDALNDAEALASLLRDVRADLLAETLADLGEVLP